MLAYLTAMLLVVLGFYVALFKKNLIKIVIGITLIENGVNLFLISLGYVKGAYAPIYTLVPLTSGGGVPPMVFPAPQALTLTAIVIGLATTGLMLALVVMIYRNYRTLDSREIGGLLGG